MNPAIKQEADPGSDPATLFRQMFIETHAAEKLKAIFERMADLHEQEPDSDDEEQFDPNGDDIFKSANTKEVECVCPECKRPMAATRFAPHLEKCLGMGRTASRRPNARNASAAKVTTNGSTSDDLGDQSDQDWSDTPPKRKTGRPKKKAKYSKKIGHPAMNLCSVKLERMPPMHPVRKDDCI